MARQRRRRTVRSLWMQECLESRRPLAVDINLFKDVNDQVIDMGLTPRNLTRVGPHVYFTATTLDQGSELWRTDGTAAGTSIVKDIRPGAVGSSINTMNAVGNQLFFLANDGVNGQELWRSDGTADGTIRLTNINPGTGGISIAAPRNANVNGLFYFAPSSDGRLWMSDGTVAGTAPLSNAGTSPNYLTNVSGQLYYRALNPNNSNASELWFAQQRSAQTTGVQIPSGTFANVNGVLYMGSTSLHRFDPATGRRTLVRDMTTTFASMVNANGTLFFNVFNSQIWKSDGTFAGTTRLAASSLTFLFGPIVNIGSTIYFAGTSTAGGGAELWTSDGTEAGTKMLKDINPGTANALVQDLLVVGDRLYFRATDGLNGLELWTSDGTAAGTVMVKDLLPGNTATAIGNMAELNGRAVFAPGSGSNGADLWWSDGTDAGTVPITAPLSQGASSSASAMFKVGDQYFFSANNGNGRELWVTDGSPDGTRLVKDINPGISSSSPTYLTEFRGKLYFRANDGASGDELWRSDGTAAGTVRVSDISPGSLSSNPTYLTNAGGNLYFAANDNVNGIELWKSDGTEAGTALFKEYSVGPASSYPRSLYNHNGNLFFAFKFNSLDWALWKTDGTLAGTQQLQSNPLSSNGHVPSELTTLGNNVIFADHVNPGKAELWIANTTGAAQLKDIHPTDGSDPTSLTRVGNQIFFAAQEPTNGRELWKTDGTAAGTLLVKDLVSGTANSSPTKLVAVNNLLYFVAQDSAGVTGLYKSDGTATGTTLIRNMQITSMANINGRLTMIANDLGGTPQIWTSDSTTSGTIPIATPGGQTTGAVPDSMLTNIEDQTIFNVRSQVYGDELYVISATDMGDAATQTLFQDNGARHAAVGPRLGILRDSTEADGRPGHLALGDDSQGVDDEDAISGTVTLTPGAATLIGVTVSDAVAATRLNSWIDWNKDGDWDDAGEQVLVNSAVTNGVNAFSIDVPANATLGLTTARFRLANQSNLGPTGFAFTGEVEDYAWQVGSSAVLQLPAASTTIQIRRNGANLQVIDTGASTTLLDVPLSSTTSLQIVGSNTQVDSMHLDFAAGGFFTLSDGIDLSGLQGGTDLLKVTGVAGLTAQYSLLLDRGNQPLITFRNGADSLALRYSDFEDLAFNQLQSFDVSGSLEIGATTWHFDVDSPVVLGQDTRLSGGMIIADRVQLPASATLVGSGTVTARFSGEASSTITLTGPLSIGNSTAGDGFVTAGSIVVANNVLTLLDSNAAELGASTSLGLSGATGRIAAANGLLLTAGESITGFGTLDTPNDSTKPLASAGSIVGNNTSERITIAGYTEGTGRLANVIVGGTVNPGSNFGSVSYGAITISGRLVIEIGGPTVGTDYDRINLDGIFTAGGTFEARIVNGFAPAVDQAFTVMSSSATLTGSFAAIVLPTLASPMRMMARLDANEYTLRVSDVALPSLPLSVAESSVPFTTVINRPADSLGQDLTVTLSSSDDTELTVTATVVIPAGQQSATVSITPVDDTLLDGVQVVTITGSAPGYAGFTRTIRVTDNETLSLSILPNPIFEGDSAVATVTRNNTDIDADLIVNITVTGDVQAPATVTIPAGQASTTFLVSAPNRQSAGFFNSTVTATAAGYLLSPQRTLTVRGTATLSLAFDQSVYHEQQNTLPGVGIVTRSGGDFSTPVTISLFSSDTTEATVPATVVIPAFQTSATFAVTPKGDATTDGLQNVTITATSTSYVTGTGSFGVTDAPLLAVRTNTPIVREDSSIVILAIFSSAFSSRTISLANTNSKLIVPDTVTLNASSFTTDVVVPVLDNALLDGAIAGEITPAFAGMLSQPLSVTVRDIETLTVAINQPVSEPGGSAQATVTRSNTDIAQPVVVNLSTSSQISIPSQVTIPAGQASVNFTITANDDTRILGTRYTPIVPQSAGYLQIPGQVIITDNEALTLQLDHTSFPEKAGLATATIRRTNSDISQPLVVYLFSSDLTEARVPSSVTIPANQDSATFVITAVDDAFYDGTQSVTITAMASPYINVSQVVSVLDVEPLLLTATPLIISEDGTTALATVTRNPADIAAALTVNIVSSDTTEASVAVSVVIPAGQSTATFLITGVNDDLFDGDQSVRVTVSALNAEDASVDLVVQDSERLTLTVSPSSISERDGVATATVSRGNTLINHAVTVTLTSSDTSEATVPASVEIPAGQSSVNFQATIVDDNLLDGPQAVTIIATSAGYQSSDLSITVEDWEELQLSLSVTTVRENAGSITATVNRSNTDIAQPLVVTFSSSDTSQATVPNSVTILAGQSSATFSITIIDDNLLDGPQIVEITASHAAYQSASQALTVEDYENLTLSFAPISISENGGVSTGTITRSNTDTSLPLAVTLASSDITEATVPTDIVIPAGRSSVTFTVTAVDDSLLDGLQTVVVTTSATGYESGSESIVVTDAETLTLVLADSVISEKAGATSGTVIRNNTDLTLPLTVNLTRTNPSQVTIPDSVVIPAGESSVTFNVTAIDDLLLDGDQTSIFTANATGYASDSRQLTITDYETLSLQLTATPISELDGISTVTLTRSNTDLDQPLTVSLLSSDTSEAVVPATVTIPAGQAFVAFVITAVDDSLLDGTQSVTITALADGYLAAIESLSVSDYEELTLSFTSTQMSEAGGTIQGTVTRSNTDIASPLVVSLTSSDTTEATVPSEVTIPAGQSSVTFTITAVDDALLDGTQVVSLAASATGYVGDSKSLSVLDQEQLTLSFTSTQMSEAGGTIQGTATRSNTDIAAPLVVSLTSGDTTEATVPDQVTIPAGQASVTFTITAVDDALLDGTQVVSVAASATGYVGDSKSLSVLDQEQITLSFTSTQMSEAGGTIQGTVTRSNTDITAPLVVSLTSSDTTETAVPAQVTIPAGQASVTFTITAVDDALLDGTQVVSLAASTAGYDGDTKSLSVLDQEQVTLSFTSSQMSEAGGTIQGTATRSNTDIAAPLVVSLTSSDTTEATVPAEVTIPAGQSSVTFTVTAVDDALLDGTQLVSLAVSATGYVGDSKSLSVLDQEQVTLSFTSTQMSEAGGMLQGTVTRSNTDIAAPLVVSLTSSDTTEATVPAEVTIPAGQSSVTFTVTAVDDALLDGTQVLSLAASTTGYVGDSRSLSVLDQEQITLSFTSTQMSEAGGTIQGTVTRSNTDIAAPLVVSLSSSDTTEATVPVEVTIPAGQVSASFTVTAVDDTWLDGVESVQIVAAAAGYTDGTQTLQVTDAETLTLTVQAASFSEKDGSTTATLTRSNTDLDSPLVVQLASSDSTAASVPSSVIILAGQASVTFTVTGVDDLALDGPQTATLTASAAGYQSGTSEVSVLDNERQFPWQSPRNSLDVNDSGQVTAIDALLVINAINIKFVLTPNLPDPFVPVRYVDVNGDNVLSAIDALLVINELNRQSGASGESPVEPSISSTETTSGDNELLELLAVDICSIGKRR